MIDYKINNSCSFKILVISLKNKDDDEAINIIENKIKNNQKINQTEIDKPCIITINEFWMHYRKTARKNCADTK